MAKIRAVVFDMYDTLVPNPQEDWFALFDGICRSQGFRMEARLLYREWKVLEMEFRHRRLNLAEPYRSPPFQSYEEAWRDCFRDLFSCLELEGDPAAAAKAAVDAMAVRELYEDAVQVLPVVQERWRTALLSNADDDYLLPLVERLGLKFQAVLSSERVRAYKPHPLPFQRILEWLRLEPHEAVYVGDNPFDDVLGAKGAGMAAVWLNRAGVSMDDGMPSPDYEARSLTELPEILERWK